MKKTITSITVVFTFLFIIFPLLSANKISSFENNFSKELSYPVVEGSSKKKSVKRNSAIIKFALQTAIKNYFTKAIAKRSIVGAAVSIVKCDSILLSEGYGRRKVNSRKLIDNNTVFRLGSLSKGFAGVLAGIEVQEGKLNWDSKVTNYVPNFKVRGEDRTQKITLAHVLSQSTGLPYHSFTNLVEDGVDMNVLAEKFNEIEPIAEPGKIYSYQNAMYAMGGLMIESAEQKPMNQILQEKIFNPLAMRTASATYEDLMKHENIAYPHRKRYGRYRAQKINKKYYNAVAAGGINASATDMAKWMRFLLGNQQEVLSTKILKQVLAPQVKIPGKHKYYQKWKGHQSSYYGFGWRTHTFKDRESGKILETIHHGGTVSSYRTEIAIFPDEDLGISVLFNCTTKLAKTVIPDLKEIVKNVINTPLKELEANTLESIL